MACAIGNEADSIAPPTTHCRPQHTHTRPHRRAPRRRGRVTVPARSISSRESPFCRRVRARARAPPQQQQPKSPPPPSPQPPPDRGDGDQARVLRGFQAGIFGLRGWLHLQRPLSRQRIADTVRAATGSSAPSEEESAEISIRDCQRRVRSRLRPLL